MIDFSSMSNIFDAFTVLLHFGYHVVYIIESLLTLIPSILVLI